MSKFLVSGILQRETSVKVDELPIKYQPVTDTFGSIHSGIGGDSYNEAIALKWLGNEVSFFTMIGTDEDAAILNSNNNDIVLNTDFVLPRLYATPAAVIFYDQTRKQQIFEDIKDSRSIEYDLDLFKSQLKGAEILITANANFCRPLLQAAIEDGKKIRNRTIQQILPGKCRLFIFKR